MRSIGWFVALCIAGCGSSKETVPPPVSNAGTGAAAAGREWSLEGRDLVRWSEARRRCDAKGQGWRLPSKAELGSLLADPGAPRLPEEGVAWGGEPMSRGPGAPWVPCFLELGAGERHGLMAKGTDRIGGAVCVRGGHAAEPDPALIALGPDDPALTVVVALSPDEMWRNALPTLARLQATYRVRFELRLFKLAPEYGPALLAWCAVARSQAFVRFSDRWASAPADQTDEAGELRALAIGAGVAAADYDRDLAGPCVADVLADTQWVTGLGVDGTPRFWVGAETIHGWPSPTAGGEAPLEAAIKRALVP